MSIHRINHFTAKKGAGEQLAKAFARVIPKIRAADGCISCSLFTSMEHPEKVIILEEWQSKDAHKQAASIIGTKDLAVIMPLLADKPGGEYLTQAG